MKRFKVTYVVCSVILLLGSVILISFDQKEDEGPEIEEFVIPLLVKKELKIKLEKYKQTIIDKCKTKAIEEAEFYIDSLVAEELKFQASDTLKFPAKPVRPNLSEPIILNDSMEIGPISKEQIVRPDSEKIVIDTTIENPIDTLN
ncbi:MAG: hypothetical protein AAGA77_04670 [Bacteroidota bacterium]